MTHVAAKYVEETRFGFWFLQSHVWQHHVLRVAINDLQRLADKPLPVYGEGLNVRDWLYVADHCKAIDLIITGLGLA